MKKIYHITFWNKKDQMCDTFIKACNEYDAEQKFNKKYPYYLLRTCVKISRNSK